MPRRMAFDRWIFFTGGLLLVSGLLMVGSASYYVAASQGQSPYHFFFKHLVHVGLGVVAFIAALRLPYQKLDDRRLVLWMIVGSAILLVLVLTMPAAGGARRWFRLGPLAVQPSEPAKLVTIVFLAYLLARREREVNDLRRVPLPCTLGVAPLALLVLAEPDLGSAVMIVLTAFVMLFVAGLRFKYIAAVAGAGLVALAATILMEPYRIVRVLVYLGLAEDAQGAGFQITQSLIAFGSGGFTGAGLGQGQQKAFFLPAAHTDFIFAVVGEELGLLGTSLLLLAFLLLLWRGLRTALKAPDRFGFYLAIGFTSLVALQALIHMGVCTWLLPTKGLPLPFISYGGSSLVATMAAIGVLLNVSQHSN